MYKFSFVVIGFLLFLNACVPVEPLGKFSDDPAILVGYALFYQSCGAAPARPDFTCPSIPAQASLRLEDQSIPANFFQIDPDSTGYFEIQSPPGSYVIKLMEENGMMSAPPKVLLLKAGEKTEITFKIRALTQ